MTVGQGYRDAASIGRFAFPEAALYNPSALRQPATGTGFATPLKLGYPEGHTGYGRASVPGGGMHERNG